MMVSRRNVVSGIYKIVLFDGRCYVGSSQDIYQRWYQHRRHLQNGTHHAYRLQDAWNLHGPDGFTFLILEQCHKTDLIKREQVWLDTAKADFNTAQVAGGGSSGHVPSAETRAKMSAARNGIVRKPGEGSAPFFSLYFEERTARLIALGLDPENDEDWAMPDYELGIDEFDFEDDHQFFFDLEPYDSKSFVLCQDCFEAPAEPRSANVNSGVLCYMCRFDWEQRNPEVLRGR